MRTSKSASALRATLLGASAIGLGLSGIGIAAHAQESDFVEATDEARTLGTVIITSERREQSLQDAPLAVTALTAETLETQQIASIEDIQLVVPNLTFGSLTNFTQISLRGVGLDVTTLAGETSVATFQDGVYLGQTFVQNVPSFDLERVEVLRGPQGTLYGRNATGGAINFISRDPSEVPEFNAGLTIGNYDRIAVDLGASGPLSDVVSARASLQHDQRSGYRDNLLTGEDEDDLDSIAGRVALVFEPNSDFKFTFRGDVTDRETSPVNQAIASVLTPTGTTPEMPVGPFSLPGAVLGQLGLIPAADAAALGLQTPADFFGLTQPGVFTDPTETTDFYNDAPSESQFDVWGISGTVEWNLSEDVLLKSITAHRDSEFTSMFDNDGTSASVLASQSGQGGEQFTQEINLIGTSFDDRLDWVLGAFYFDEEAEATFNFDLVALGELINLSGSTGTLGAPPFNLNIAGGGAPILPLLQLGADPLLGQSFATGQIPATGYLGFQTFQDSQSIAIFGQGTWHASDNVRLTGGLRYSEDEKDVRRSLRSNFVPVVALCDEAPESQTWDAVTGTAAIDFDVDEDTLIYGRVSRGYKAGGFNPGACAGSFDPETLWSYEVGLRSQPFGRQVTANATAFYYDYTDIQFTTYIGNAAIIDNAADAKIYGAELEFVIAPDSAPGFRADGSISYLNSEYGEFSFQDPFALATLDVEGNQLIRAPEWKFNVGAEYTFSGTPIGDLTFRGETAYSDDYFHDIFNGQAPGQSATAEDSYTISNFRVIWAPTGTPDFQIQGFVENIEDTLYAFARPGSATSGNISGQFSAPQTYGVRITKKWGG